MNGVKMASYFKFNSSIEFKLSLIITVALALNIHQVAQFDPKKYTISQISVYMEWNDRCIPLFLDLNKLNLTLAIWSNL